MSYLSVYLLVHTTKVSNRATVITPALEAPDTEHIGGSKSRARVKLGAMNEAWAAGYRLNQDTGCAY